MTKIRLYPRATLAVAAFLFLLAVGLDARLGLAAVLAVAAIDALSFLLPLGFWRNRDRR
jgi:hypothetical protein